MSGHEDPQANPRHLRSGIYEAIAFIRVLSLPIDAELCDFSGYAALARLLVSPA